MKEFGLWVNKRWQQWNNAVVLRRERQLKEGKDFPNTFPNCSWEIETQRQEWRILVKNNKRKWGISYSCIIFSHSQNELWQAFIWICPFRTMHSFADHISVFSLLVLLFDICINWLQNLYQMAFSQVFHTKPIEEIHIWIYVTYFVNVSIPSTDACLHFLISLMSMFGFHSVRKYEKVSAFFSNVVSGS